VVGQTHIGFESESVDMLLERLTIAMLSLLTIAWGVVYLFGVGQKTAMALTSLYAGLIDVLSGVW